MDASTKQQMPTNGKTDILPLVIEDLKKRDIIGTKKYGTTLQSNNGRDALIDGCLSGSIWHGDVSEASNSGKGGFIEE